VARVEGSGEQLAARLRAGFGPLAVAGQMGCGKSTELAAAEAALRPGGITCAVQMDRLLDMRHVDVEDVYRHLGNALFEEIRADAERFPAMMAIAVSQVGELRNSGRRDLLLSALREIAQAAPHHRKASLLIDGLEKCSETDARKVVRTLLGFADEANLAIVVPTSMVTGPDAHELLSSMEVFPIRAVLVDGEPSELAERGRLFFWDLALRRLGGPLLDLVKVVHRAAVSSGGVPRVFLQLLRDAKRYAVLAERDDPTLSDLEDAERDHAEHLERLLSQGDVSGLRAADNTTGREIDPGRRLRFLLHGLLLEYKAADRVFVRPAPLLSRALAHENAA
jgi:hypothetical protein